MFASAPHFSFRSKRPAAFCYHEVCGLDVGVGLGNGELDSLILADLAPEYFPLIGPLCGPVYKEAAVAYALGGD